jgi:hypothetical protein
MPVMASKVWSNRMMGLVCEDLARYGAVLIPPYTPEYFELLADIEHRLQSRPEGAPPIKDGAISRTSEHDTGGSAILVNRADVAIASIAYVWSGTLTCAPGTNPSVLLPFGLDDRSRKIHAYWNTICPGSKRLMTCDGMLFGDNTDVRSPAADELSQGGWCGVGAGRGSDRPKPVKLTLDGVFFVDGGFAGPNQLGSWEHTVSAAEECLAYAALAREARSKGTPSAEFFAQVQALTGQTDERRMPIRMAHYWRSTPLDPEPIRKYERQMAGWRVLSMRKSLGDEAALARVEAWADAPVPKFHKL